MEQFGDFCAFVLLHGGGGPREELLMKRGSLHPLLRLPPDFRCFVRVLMILLLYFTLNTKHSARNFRWELDRVFERQEAICF